MAAHTIAKLQERRPSPTIGNSQEVVEWEVAGAHNFVLPRRTPTGAGLDAWCNGLPEKLSRSRHLHNFMIKVFAQLTFPLKQARQSDNFLLSLQICIHQRKLGTSQYRAPTTLQSMMNAKLSQQWIC